MHDAPPMVLSSPVVKIPIIGQALEFGMSPVKMTKRCYDQYGPVFTVPVSFLNLPQLNFMYFFHHDIFRHGQINKSYIFCG